MSNQQTIDQKEYLKKYLSHGKDSGTKKKKKKPKVVPSVKIIDDDLDTNFVNLIEDNPYDEDAPQIVAVIDDRPPSMRLDERTKDNLWKPIGPAEIPAATEKLTVNKFTINKTSNKSSGDIKTITHSKLKTVSSQSSRQRDTNQSSRKNANSDGDRSPPRKSRFDKGDDISPPRKKYSSQSDDDHSPPRKAIKTERDSDSSPPRRNRRPEVLDSSPPRRKGENRHIKQETLSGSDNEQRDYSSNTDLSPARRQDGDAPPRRRKYDDDISPPRKLKHDNDISPPRRRKSDDDISPPRRRKPDDDFSPPKRKKPDDDFSPPRKRKHQEDSSPPRRRKDNDNSPQRKSRIKSRWHSEDRSPPRNKENETNDKLKRTLDGKVAGLQKAADLSKELKQFKKREEEIFNKLSAEESGVNARSVIRDRKTGKIRNLQEEALEKQRKEQEENKRKEKYDRWGRGLKQIEDGEKKVNDMIHEMNKPLARYAEDEDLERFLKEKEHEGDPMLREIRAKKRKKAIEEGNYSEKPQYMGEFMPNRYGIRPGHRWDGVDRSNGFEKKYFQIQNERTALREESYKWSTEDM